MVLSSTVLGPPDPLKGVRNWESSGVSALLPPGHRLILSKIGPIYNLLGFSGKSVIKNPLANATKMSQLSVIATTASSELASLEETQEGKIPTIEQSYDCRGPGRYPGEGNCNPLQYSCLENPWTEEPGRLQSIGSQKSQTWLRDQTTTWSLMVKVIFSYANRIIHVLMKIQNQLILAKKIFFFWPCNYHAGSQSLNQGLDRDPGTENTQS